MARLLKGDQRAFSLLEIIAALGVAAVILVLILRIAKTYEDQDDVAQTRSRMEEIVKSAKAYYLRQGDLPIFPVGDIPVDIPVGTGRLDIDAKIRFDRWQQPMRYISYANDGEEGRPGEILVDPLSPGAPGGAPQAMVVISAGTRTLLRAIEFEGRRVAGLIISSGPNQQFEYGENTSVYPAEYQLDDATTPEISDDIVVPIDLTAEATHMAMAELKVLNEKVSAFEDRYLGVDNDVDDPAVYDEAGCRGIPYGFNPVPFGGVPNPFTDCSQLTLPRTFTAFPPGTNRDINCGRPTLDYMKAHFCPQPWGTAGGCPPGYYVPEIAEVPPIPNPQNPGTLCPGTPRTSQPLDYARIPFIQGAPQPDDCHWGLVATQYGDAVTQEPNETDADQARAFITCLFNLSPDAVVDPWLNGYVWGCSDAIDATYDANGNQYAGCQYAYPIDDPHCHRFFSAGPDGLPARLEAEIETTPEDREATDDIMP